MKFTTNDKHVGYTRKNVMRNVVPMKLRHAAAYTIHVVRYARTNSICPLVCQTCCVFALKYVKRYQHYITSGIFRIMKAGGGTFQVCVYFQKCSNFSVIFHIKN